MRTAEAGACTERKPPRIRAKVSLYYYSPASRAPGFVTPVLLLGSSSFSSPAHPRPRVTSAPLPPQQSSVLSPRVLLESLVTHEQRNLDTHLSDDHDEHSVLFSCSWRLSKRNKRKGGKRVGSPSYAFFNSRSASSSSSQERTARSSHQVGWLWRSYWSVELVQSRNSLAGVRGQLRRVAANPGPLQVAFCERGS